MFTLIFIFLLILISIELFCHVVYLIHYKFNLSNVVGSGIKLDMDHIYDPIKGYKLLPFTNYQGLMTNEFGHFINSATYDPLAEYQEDIYKIFIFGGSTVAGYGVDTPEETFPAILEKELKLRISNNIKVFNFGVGGYTSIQEFLLFLENINLKPNMVIVYDGWNDISYSLLKPFDSIHNSNTSPFAYNYIYSKLVSEISIHKYNLSFYGFSFNHKYFINSLYSIRALNYILKRQVTRFNLSPNETCSRYLTIIDAFKSVCFNNNIPFYSFLQPVLLFKNFKSKEEILNFKKYDIYSSSNCSVITEFYKLLNVFSKTNYYYTDLSKIFVNNKSHLFTDYCHLNNEGNILVSNAIYNSINEEILNVI